MKYFLGLFLLMSASFTVLAQDCKGYYYLSNGQVEMTMYDRKQKENGKVTYTISNSTKANGTTTANFVSEVTNESGKVISTGTGKYKCTGGILYVDAKVAMPSEGPAQGKDMEVQASDDFIEYPATMSVGMSLKDADFKMNTSANGPSTTVEFSETNRKVVAQESVTSAAGTWQCWKITYDALMRASVSGIGIPIRMKVTEWFAPGFGIVKSETANKNGKLMASTLITKVQK